MTGAGEILLVTGGETPPSALAAALSAAGAVRAVRRAIPGDGEPGAVVFLDGALVDDPTAPARFGASSLAPLLLAGRGARPPGVAEAVPPEDAAGVAARVRVLAEFGALRREAAEVGLKPADLAAEFERSGLPAGLVDERWLLLPGRVRLRDLADPAGVLSRHEAVCRLMGTAFGLFFDDGAPREGEAGESPLATLSPYCAYLASRGDLCAAGEHGAAARAMRGGAATQVACPGGIRLVSVPVLLSFRGIAWPLAAANLAAGGPPESAGLAAVSARYGPIPRRSP